MTRFQPFRPHLVAIGLLAAIVAAGCSNSNPAGSAAPGTKVTAGSLRFEPSHVTINEGDPPTLLVTSADHPHTFTIDALSVSAAIPAGQTVAVSVATAPKGTYTFYCAVGTHRANGMVGTLVITRTPTSNTGGGDNTGGGYYPY